MIRPRTGAPASRHLFAHWAFVARRLRAADRLLFFLDFDGTLLRIRPHPGQERLKGSVRRVLHRLARNPRVTVYLISGRRRDDLRKRADVPGVRYLGLHGWEQSEKAKLPPAVRAMLQLALRRLSKRLARLRGVWIKDKRACFVVHYRGARPAEVRRARAALREVLAPLEPGVRVLRGKKVWEVMPRELEGKGAAVREIMGKFRRSVFPICVGDDVSDESAFAVLGDGLTVRVGGSRRSKARFELRNPKEVYDFLVRVEEELA